MLQSIIIIITATGAKYNEPVLFMRIMVSDAGSRRVQEWARGCCPLQELVGIHVPLRMCMAACWVVNQCSHSCSGGLHSTTIQETLLQIQTARGLLVCCS